MRKDHIRDYATEAFRFYAAVGGKDKYIDYLISDIQRETGSGVIKPTEAALISKEKLMESRTAELADLEAVEQALLILGMGCQGRHIVQAIEYVYFKDCDNELGRGDITERVHQAEINIPASESQIYRWLRKARELFAEERGLRL